MLKYNVDPEIKTYLYKYVDILSDISGNSCGFWYKNI